MLKKNKFQHKWIFGLELGKCEETKICCATYKEGKRFVCYLERQTHSRQVIIQKCAIVKPALGLEPR